MLVVRFGDAKVVKEADARKVGVAAMKGGARSHEGVSPISDSLQEMHGIVVVHIVHGL
jgi:hypothetical protein